MIDDDLITATPIEDDEDEEFDDENMEPLVGIAKDRRDGSLAFQTTLATPTQLLWVLRSVENKLLEDYFG